MELYNMNLRHIKQDIDMVVKNSDLSKCNTIEYCEKINFLFYTHNQTLIANNLVNYKLNFRINIIKFTNEVNYIKLCRNNNQNYLLVVTDDNYIFILNTDYIKNLLEENNIDLDDFWFKEYKNIINNKINFFYLKLLDYNEDNNGIWSIDFNFKFNCLYFSSNKKRITKIIFDEKYEYQIQEPIDLIHDHNIPTISISTCYNFLLSGSIDKNIRLFNNEDKIILKYDTQNFIWHVRWFNYFNSYNLSDYFIIVGTKSNIWILRVIENMKISKIKNIRVFLGNFNIGNYYHYTFIYKNVLIIPYSLSKILVVIFFNYDSETNKYLFSEKTIIINKYLSSISGTFIKNKKEILIYLENVIEKKIETFSINIEKNKFIIN